MALNKIEYNTGDTLTAEQVNEMQDAIIENEENKFDKSGGTLTGNQLGFKNNSSNIYSGDKWVEFYNNQVAGDESNRSGIRIQSDVNLNESIKGYRQVDGTKTFYNIHGEHNKTSGSYVGDGSATRREINTEGIGKVVLVYGNGHISLITEAGGVSFSIADSKITSLSIAVTFKNGIITIATATSQINANNVTYNYIVL